MFDAQLPDALTFKKIIDAIRDLVDSCNIVCSADGMRIIALDKSHVTMISLFLSSESFAHYTCDTPVNLGVKLDQLHKITKIAANDDAITFRCRDHPESLRLIFEPADGYRVSDFELKLLDLEATDYVPTDAENCCVSMNSATFQRTLRDLSSIGDLVKIKVSPHNLWFNCSGEASNGSIRLSTSGTDNALTISCSKELELSFSMNYLLNFAKATPLAERVQILMDPERPMTVKYEFDDFNSNLSFYLAPKFEDNDEQDEQSEEEQEIKREIKHEHIDEDEE